MFNNLFATNFLRTMTFWIENLPFFYYEWQKIEEGN